jgi:phytoene dehydrogenase-like protein
VCAPELGTSGAHTLTVFGLQVPAAPPGNVDGWRDRLERAVLTSLRSVLAEPLDDLLLADGDGRPCIDTVTTPDLERSLGMPGGHIFHGDLAWPFLDDGAPRDTPARRWGVATGHPRVLLCGAGAVRGGGVSGIGGHNAAMAVLCQES